jgi:hypothetical protein
LRAATRGSLVVAEIEAREVGMLDLREALELTALVALRDAQRRDVYAVRWLTRWLEEKKPTLEEVPLVATALAALGGPNHPAALDTLRALA